MSPYKAFVQLLLLLFACLVPAWTQRTLDCGTLNQRACRHTDWERINMVAGDNQACEVDLENVDGTCRNRRRNLLPRNRSWSGWALEYQTNWIGRNTPINFISWPGAHNVYSSEYQGFSNPLYTNQTFSITDQLNMGARHIELDPKYYLVALPSGLPVSDVALRVCHAKSTVLCALLGFSNRLFAHTLIEIAQWLDTNPGQVLYIKLDNNADLLSRIEDVYREIERYLGNRVYRVPSGTISRWPTIGEIRDAGKNVIVVRHNSAVNVPTNWVWNGQGLMQSSNHPKNQNFTTCTADDGLTPITRGKTSPMSWWDIAEGRAKTNTGDASTGLLWEEETASAARCGVAAIGMDFIGNLNSDLNVEKRDIPDRRMAAMVWSWEVNDWGKNGPTALNSRGRWSSLSPSNSLPIACATNRPFGSTDQDRQWRITSSQVPWNTDLANAQCVREFGHTYGFARPENGFQNEQLRQAANGRQVWLNISLVNVPEESFSASELTFRMDPGGSLPNAQILRVTSDPGARGGAKLVSDGVPVSFNFPGNALQTGIFDLPIAILPAAQSLTSGIYNYPFDVTIEGRTTRINIRLIVRAQPRVTSSADPGQALQGSLVTLRADFTNGFQITGDMKFYRLVKQEGVLTELLTVAASNVTPSGQREGIVKVDVRDLPLGRHELIASYFGNGSNQPAESEPFFVTIQPRIVPSPTSVSFRFSPQDSLPSANVSFSGISTNPTATASCDWVKPNFSGAVLTIGAADSIRNLPTGIHRCDVTVRDSQSNTGGGSTVIPVSVQVLTTLSVQPVRTIELLGENGASGEFSLQTGNGQNVDITITPLQPWLAVELLGASRAPGSYRIIVSGQSLPLGNHRGTVRITSPQASDAVVEVVFTKVNPTLIRTQHPGLTFTVNGQVFHDSIRFVFRPNTTISVATFAQAKDGARFRPDRWVVNGVATTGSQIQFQATEQGGTVTAMFDAFYQLIASVNQPNAGQLSLSAVAVDNYYPENSQVRISATAQPGFSFAGWTGSATSSESGIDVAMTAPKTVIANFSPIEARQVTINGIPGSSAIVDGAALNLPATVRWVPGTQHTISAVEFVAGTTGIRFRFASWSNGGGRTQTLTMGNDPIALTAAYQRQFQLSTVSSPPTGGIVNGAGWYDQGLTTAITALANTGFRFSNFSGGATGTTSPANVVMDQPREVVGNFAPEGNVVLTLSTAGARTDGPLPGQRLVPISIRNSGTGVALGVQITGVSDIRVTSGSGAVTLVSPMPMSFGDLSPVLGTSNGVLVFQWPATAARIQFTVTFVHANGVPGVTTLNLIR